MWPQYQESDLDFASRLMEEEGIYYFFKFTQGAHKLVLANTPQSHPDLPGGAQVIFETMEGGERDGRTHFQLDQGANLGFRKVHAVGSPLPVAA